MAKAKSKNQIALDQARERMEKAQSDFDKAVAEVNTAKAVLKAYEEAYYGLNGAFSRPKSVAPSAAKKSGRKNATAESGANTGDGMVTVSVVGASGN